MELAILDWIQENLRSDAMDFIMSHITLLGNAGIMWIIIAAALILWKKYRPLGLTMAAGLVSSLVVGNVILKNLFARPRPCWINDTVDLLIAMPEDYSFPSGHTLCSFISATIIFQYNRAWGIAAYILSGLIAFSRMYLYVHFLTDVLAGVILGIAIGLLVSKISMKIAPQKS